MQRVINNGSLLQAYGLKKCIEKLGHRVEFVDYKSSDIQSEKFTKKEKLQNFSPILYTVDMFPPKFQWILYLNPMTHLVDSYRDIFYYKTMPDVSSLVFIAIFALLVLGIGYIIFRKLEKGFAEEV